MTQIFMRLWLSLPFHLQLKIESFDPFCSYLPPPVLAREKVECELPDFTSECRRGGNRVSGGRWIKNCLVVAVVLRSATRTAGFALSLFFPVAL